jgi:hypothetical protein
MKKTIALTIAILGITASTRAQWIVYDPAMNVQQIIDTAQEIAKYVQMIQNQVQQIQTLTDQLNEFKNYEAVFGNPKNIVLSMVPSLNADLQKIEPGINLENLLTTADGAYALAYNEAGIFKTVGDTFTTPGGKTITRPADVYKPYAAVSRTADNYVAVADDAATRRTAIKNQIAQTTEQLKNATTDAEVQKLQGVLTGLSADLNSTDAEVNQAVGSALVQDIQNRNDQQKQVQALTEQQNAEFEESVSNYKAKFQLLNEPTVFPTP